MQVENSQEFENVTSTGRTIVFFNSKQCPSCRSIAPFFNQLVEETKISCPQLKFMSIDILDHEDIAQKYTITKVPTFISLVDGVQAKKIIGPYRDDLQTLVEKNCKALK